MTKTEAKEWLKSIKEKYIHGGDDFYDYQRRTAIDYAIENIVEVVRCKDCEFWGGVTFGNVCRRWSAPLAGMKNCTTPDDFCSYGERRTNERKAD